MMYGYCPRKDFRFLETRLNLPFELAAIALYPSSLISYTHSGPWGSFDTERQSIGSMNAASRRGSESIVSMRNVFCRCSVLTRDYIRGFISAVCSVGQQRWRSHT